MYTYMDSYILAYICVRIYACNMCKYIIYTIKYCVVASLLLCNVADKKFLFLLHTLEFFMLFVGVFFACFVYVGY